MRRRELLGLFGGAATLPLAVRAPLMPVEISERDETILLD